MSHGSLKHGPLLRSHTVPQQTDRSIMLLCSWLAGQPMQSQLTTDSLSVKAQHFAVDI